MLILIRMNKNRIKNILKRIEGLLLLKCMYKRTHYNFEHVLFHLNHENYDLHASMSSAMAAKKLCTGYIQNIVTKTNIRPKIATRATFCSVLSISNTSFLIKSSMTVNHAAFFTIISQFRILSQVFNE